MSVLPTSPLSRLSVAGLSVAMALLAGCQTMYYETMEKFGYEKRDLLVERVDEAREAQQEAKDQFQSALDQFIAVTGFSGGELQQQYEELKREYEASEKKAESVRNRITAVEQVAEDLFEEWEAELDQYTNARLRANSKRQLEDTRARYLQLIGAMKRAENKIEPVLATFLDQVLFLKHNLNARALASLRTDLAAVESDIAELIREMNTSIAEADDFVRSMSGA